MTKIAGIFLLFISIFTFLFGILFRNESAYRRFLKRYMAFFGMDITKLPSSEAVPDPIKPHVAQAKIASYIFIVLAIYIFLTGLYLIFL